VHAKQFAQKNLSMSRLHFGLIKNDSSSQTSFNGYVETSGTKS
jgi:hypothetical protein